MIGSGHSLLGWCGLQSCTSLSNACQAVATSFSFFFSSRRRHTRFDCDWSSDVCSSDLLGLQWQVQRFHLVAHLPAGLVHVRSEERRVGKEGRSRWSPYHLKKKKRDGWHSIRGRGTAAQHIGKDSGSGGHGGVFSPWLYD